MLKLYFLGSGAIAVPVLAAFSHAPDMRLVGVGTQMDRPAGRHRHPQPTPVGAWARAHGLEPDQPSSVNHEDFLRCLQALSPDMVFVAAFGQLLGERLLALPSHGCINLHTSLLPAWRGAAPVAAAIRNGDAATGISFMRMERGLDTGPVYAQCRHPLAPDVRADELERQLGELAAQEAGGVLRAIAAGELSARPQDNARASHAGKIVKADGELDWRESAALLARKIRAYHPWPGMSFVRERNGRRQRLKITAGRAAPAAGGVPGEVLQADAHGWLVATGEAALELHRVIPEGSREMTAADYLRGAPLAPGARLPLSTQQPLTPIAES